MNTKFQITDQGIVALLSTPHVKAQLKPTVTFDQDLATLNDWLSKRIAVRQAQGYAAEDASTLAVFDLSIANDRGMLIAKGSVSDFASPSDQKNALDLSSQAGSPYEPTAQDLLRFDLFPRLYDQPAQQSARQATHQTAPQTNQQTFQFAEMENKTPGVYPIVEKLDDLRRLLDAGVEIIQLRIKSEVFTPEIDRAVADAVRAASHYPAAQLFINDYWQAAMAHGAFGIHLGQEDLLVADLPKIAKAGIRLGVSSHSFWEVARAARILPSYIACGPVFPTRAKVMPWIPQGVENLRYWVALLPFPVVGIGGIHAGNLAEVCATGCAAASVIQAVTADPNPAQAYQALQGAWRLQQKANVTHTGTANPATPTTHQHPQLAKPTLTPT